MLRAGLRSLVLLAVLLLVLVVSTYAREVSVKATALKNCQPHGGEQSCTAIPTNEAVRVISSHQTDSLPTSYTNCRPFETAFRCKTPVGEAAVVEILFSDSDARVKLLRELIDLSPSSDENPLPLTTSDDGASTTKHSHCRKSTGTYNILWRICSIFVVMLTSGIAVYAPLVLRQHAKDSSTDTSTSSELYFMGIKQFGTGVIVSTAYIHLLMHSTIMYSSECVGKLSYDSYPTAIAMFGGLVAFSIEFWTHRYADSRARRRKSIDEAEIEVFRSSDERMPLLGIEREEQMRHDRLGLAVMEMGVLFHSFLVGVTLVIAGDRQFWTLLIVVVFHQMFEGLALGSRIEACRTMDLTSKRKYAAGFALITPVGMAGGLFLRTISMINENSRGMMLGLGALEAFCAGILLWVGLVEMLAHDWIFGELKDASLKKTWVGMVCLVLGMLGMAVLGIWA